MINIEKTLDNMDLGEYGFLIADTFRKWTNDLSYYNVVQLVMNDYIASYDNFDDYFSKQVEEFSLEQLSEKINKVIELYSCETEEEVDLEGYCYYLLKFDIEEDLLQNQYSVMLGYMLNYCRYEIGIEELSKARFRQLEDFCNEFMYYVDITFESIHKKVESICNVILNIDNDISHKLDVGDFGHCLIECTEGSVIDCFDEIAECYIDTYDDVLLEFLSHNIDLINEVISNDWEGCDSDIMTAIKHAEYQDNHVNLMEHKNDILTWYILEHYKIIHETEHITPQNLQKIKNYIYDNNNLDTLMLEDVIQFAEDLYTETL